MRIMLTPSLLSCNNLLLYLAKVRKHLSRILSLINVRGKKVTLNLNWETSWNCSPRKLWRILPLNVNSRWLISGNPTYKGMKKISNSSPSAWTSRSKLTQNSWKIAWQKSVRVRKRQSRRRHLKRMNKNSWSLEQLSLLRWMKQSMILLRL